MNNLEELLKEYSIQVPIIQRDYAQGREEKRVLEIRNTFLNSISDRLIDNKNLHLDFVYGTIRNNIFQPLDGQQRLTTLFLLYWYFGKKENIDIEFLEKFTYETRATSREFCQKLVKNNFKIDFTKDNLIEYIKDSTWFLAFWENDPTIKSMLTMIESIHQKFKNNNLFDKLKNITFEFFELEKFGLDDDLYIKMNARGKPLTEFENFKAEFEQFLSEKDEELKKEFETKIDNQWTDFFWNYKDEDYLIDKAFMNYFYYLSEMLYNKINSNSETLNEINFKIIEDIYSDIENIRFLFKSLDKLDTIKDNFNSLFSSDIHETGKVTLFEKDINFLNHVIEKGHSDRLFGAPKKIILFLVIYHLIDGEIDDNFKDFIRVVRNVIEKSKSLKQGSLQYTLTFNYKDLHKLLNIFLKYIDKDIYSELLMNSNWQHKEFNHEIEKAKLINKDISFKKIIFELEDYKYLKGDIRNFLNDDIDKMKLYSKYIKEIFDEKNDDLIIRAMISTGDCRLSKGGTRIINHRYFLGKQGYWEIFLTNSNFDKNFSLQGFIEKYTDNNYNLQEVINTFVLAREKKDWQYYFIKYQEMLKIDEKLSKDKNFFAWNNDFDIEKMGGSNLGAFHINPYIKTVALKTNDKYAQYTKGEDKSYIKIENYIDKITSEDKNWTIKFSKDIDNKIKEDLIEEFSLEKKNTNFILSVKNNDRIELAVNLIEFIERNEPKKTPHRHTDI